MFNRNNPKLNKMLFFSEHGNLVKLEFDVGDLFMFGSPLSLVLAYRKISSNEEKTGQLLWYIKCSD